MIRIAIHGSQSFIFEEGIDRGDYIEAIPGSVVCVIRGELRPLEVTEFPRSSYRILATSEWSPSQTKWVMDYEKFHLI